MFAPQRPTPPPTFTPVRLGCDLVNFRPITADDIVVAVHALPDKQCASDPMFYPPTNRCLRLSEIHKQRAAVVYGKLSHACSDHSPGGATIFNNKSPLLRSPVNKHNKYIVNSITNCWWINTVHNSFDVIWLFLNCVCVSIHLVLRTRWILTQTQMRNNHYHIEARCALSIYHNKARLARCQSQ